MKPRETVMLVTLAALWGASFLFMRIAAVPFGPIPLIAARLFIAAIAFLPLVRCREDFPTLLRNWKPLLGIGTSRGQFLLLSHRSR
ncbi:MAG: EamA family transporter [Limisphaerales bacterium]